MADGVEQRRTITQVLAPTNDDRSNGSRRRGNDCFDGRLPKNCVEILDESGGGRKRSKSPRSTKAT